MEVKKTTWCIVIPLFMMHSSITVFLISTIPYSSYLLEFHHSHNQSHLGPGNSTVLQRFWGQLPAKEVEKVNTSGSKTTILEWLKKKFLNKCGPMWGSKILASDASLFQTLSFKRFKISNVYSPFSSNVTLPNLLFCFVFPGDVRVSRLSGFDGQGYLCMFDTSGLLV